MNQIARLLSPASVAVIGASGDSRKTSGRPIAFLRKHGFEGRLYPVNPRYEQIDGLRCYPSVAELPEVPDVAIILLGRRAPTRPSPNCRHWVAPRRLYWPVAMVKPVLKVPRARKN
ncbi:CoA-binding protein [Pseudomonas sp. NA13]